MINWFRSAWRWLTERRREEPQQRADDLVELTRLSNRFEADAVAAQLRSAGLRCVVFYADANGWHPELVSYRETASWFGRRTRQRQGT
jgi:hypothetical protein